MGVIGHDYLDMGKSSFCNVSLTDEILKAVEVKELRHEIIKTKNDINNLLLKKKKKLQQKP